MYDGDREKRKREKKKKKKKKKKKGGDIRNEEAGEDDHAFADLGSVGGVVDIKHEVADRRKDHEHAEHEAGPEDEGLAAAKVLDHVQTAKGGDEVDGAEDDRGDEAVGEPGALEDGGTVVEEVVGAGELLQALQEHAEGNPVEHARAGQKLVPHLHTRLGVELLLDLVEFLDDHAVVLGHPVQLGHGAPGTVDLAVAILEARGFGEEGHAAAQDQGENDGQTKGDAPLGGAVQALGSQVDQVGNEDPQRHEQLVAADHGPTDVPRCTLTLVHGDEQRATTDPQTGHPPADDHLPPVTCRGSHLNNDPNDQDHAPQGDGPLAAKSVGNGSSDQSTDQGTDGQQSDNETGADVAEVVLAVAVLPIPVQVVAHLLESGDLTSVVSKQQTAHGDEESHDGGPKGQPGDGRVDPEIEWLLRSHRVGAGVLRLGGGGDGFPMVGFCLDTHIYFFYLFYQEYYNVMTIEEGSGGRRRYNPNEEEKEGTTRARNWLIYICQLPWLDEEKKNQRKRSTGTQVGGNPRDEERDGVWGGQAGIPLEMTIVGTDIAQKPSASGLLGPCLRLEEPIGNDQSG